MGLAVGSQVVDGKGSGVPQMGIQRRQQRRALPHDSHPGMTVAVNPTLMSLGLTKPTLQSEVVAGLSRFVTSDEQTRLETPHHPRHLPPDWVRLGAQAIDHRLEECLTLLARAARRVERGPHLNDLAHALPNRDLRLPDRLQSPVNEPRLTAQQRLGLPPFFAPTTRPKDCRTSPNASAIRKPGGWSGPPWSSLRMPRTAPR